MRVVIVEDNRTNLLTLSRLIAQLGEVLVSPYFDASEALETVRREGCDLLIVAHEPPRLDGVEIMRQARASLAADAIVVLAARAGDQAAQAAALEAGATDFLARPTQAVECKARLRNLLALRRTELRVRDGVGQVRLAVAEATKSIAERERAMMLSLARAIEFRDGESSAHLERLASISRDIGERLGLSASALEELYFAAPLHDVGKVGVSDAILGKPGALTLEERAIMQQHTVRGHYILSSSRAPQLRKAAAIALSHHERYDGAGYPHGLKGDAIPLEARIVAIADVFDALTSHRPYKPAWDVVHAREYIRNGAGTQFDPACVASFLAIDPPPAAGV